MDTQGRSISHMHLQMRILYGVVGEGMGHAMRSRVILDHLIREGHEVEIIASSKASDYLGARFEDVHRIHGLHIVTEKNRVQMGRTLFFNVLRGAAALPGQIAAYFRLIEDFEPAMVLSDFESWTYFFAKAHGLPVISIDNMQVIHRCEHTPEIISGARTDFEVTRAFVQSKLPFCDHYIITTFFHPPIIKKRTSLHLPILRPEILAATPSHGDHVLVYQTVGGGGGLGDALTASGLECRIYGMRPGIEEEQADGALRYRPFDEETFIADLASCRAVVASAGFTLMSECVHLHKPMLVTPIEDHFEQTLNGRYLEDLGYGRTTEEVTTEVMQSFLSALPGFEERLSGYTHDRNKALFEEVDLQVDRAIVGIY